MELNSFNVMILIGVGIFSSVFGILSLKYLGDEPNPRPIAKTTTDQPTEPPRPA